MELWEYRCRVVDIYDGDTLTLEVDLGFNIVHEIRIRLLDIDTPEIRGPERQEGVKAKQFVEQWVSDRTDSDDIHGKPDEWPFIVRTRKTGKYGRWLADLLPRHAWYYSTHEIHEPSNRERLQELSLVSELKNAGFDTGDWKTW